MNDFKRLHILVIIDVWLHILLLTLNVDYTCQGSFQVSYNGVFLFKRSLQLKRKEKTDL